MASEKVSDFKIFTTLELCLVVSKSHYKVILVNN